MVTSSRKASSLKKISDLFDQDIHPKNLEPQKANGIKLILESKKKGNHDLEKNELAQNLLNLGCAAAKNKALLTSAD